MGGGGDAIGAHHELALLGFVDAGHAGRRPCRHGVVVGDGVADPDELIGVELNAGIVQHLLHGQRLIGGGELRAILRRYVENMGGGGARTCTHHLLGHDFGLAGDVIPHELGDQPRIGVIGPARGEADVKVEYPALIIGFDRRLRMRRADEAPGGQKAQRQGAADTGLLKQPHGVLSCAAYLRRSGSL